MLFSIYLGVIMETAQSKTRKTYTPRYASEDENFWRNHIANFSLSGLAKTAYCKQNGINYGRFFYWIRMLSHSKTHQQSQTFQNKENHSKKIEKLLPVQLKPELTSENKSSLLCTLNMKNGCTLHIHDSQSLLIIL